MVQETVLNFTKILDLYMFSTKDSIIGEKKLCEDHNRVQSEYIANK